MYEVKIKSCKLLTEVLPYKLIIFKFIKHTSFLTRNALQIICNKDGTNYIGIVTDASIYFICV